MNPLWILPLVTVSLGVALLAVALRGVGAAAADLASRSRQLTELGQQASLVRADLDAVVARTRALPWRGDAPRSRPVA